MEKIKISKDIIELAEKIKKYRIKTKKTEELKMEKELLKNHVKELEKDIKILKLDVIEKNKHSGQIIQLEKEKKDLKLKLERSKEAYRFIVTTPRKTNTVHGEIRRELLKVRREVLICSPWITYVLEELSGFSDKKNKKKINIKIITRLVKEDIEKGATDQNKLKTLKELGADIRYNNDLHAKMIIIDNLMVILSSANLTKSGLFENYEAGVCLRDENIVLEVVQFFNDIWKESKPLTQKAIDDVLSNK